MPRGLGSPATCLFQGSCPFAAALAKPPAPPWMESLLRAPHPNLPQASHHFSLQHGRPEPTALHWPALGSPSRLTRTVHPSPSPVSQGARGGGPQSLTLRLPLPGDALLVRVYPPLHHHWPQHTQPTATSGTLHGLPTWKTPPQPCVSHTSVQLWSSATVSAVPLSLGCAY
ncbi:hypothetical protein HJG60_011642 [Phyllostomus discolor]|uniref:Uncharacterized protein n=1 Tax=Phyllostomus discolor TaxID=89673 RepID=A0A834E0Y8_9CHIR|nr:hypothetical protein HJG60_011642 [Phyllostomus discolor]